ncbi:NAD-dependent epimerase/dehydratase family protein [Candidatus Pacearchaeota archaeon]|nr:NAD-dependent epimerase/dehydratase family protein [Candidatus Pacearchaeota archaeon]
MKILVTGGAGFIGSHLVDSLVKSHDVTIIDNLSTGKKENINLHATFYNEDLNDHEIIDNIFKKEKPEIIYHLAGQKDLRKSLENPYEDVKLNIMTSVNIFELAKNNNVRHIIFSSSGGAIYGIPNELPINENHQTQPLSPYGCSKLAIEKYLNYYKNNHKIKFTILRFSNVYGPREDNNPESGIVSIFLKKMFKNNTPIIFGGNQTRDFVYIDDVIKACILAQNDIESNIYNVGTQKETDIIEIFSKLNKYFKNKYEPDYKDHVKGEIKKNCLCNKKIKENLGWVPTTSIDEGLDKTYCWFLKELNKK